jgi:hypothetical protein
VMTMPCGERQQRLVLASQHPDPSSGSHPQPLAQPQVVGVQVGDEHGRDVVDGPAETAQGLEKSLPVVVGVVARVDQVQRAIGSRHDVAE